MPSDDMRKAMREMDDLHGMTRAAPEQLAPGPLLDQMQAVAKRAEEELMKLMAEEEHLEARRRQVERVKRIAIAALNADQPTEEGPSEGFVRDYVG